MTRLINERKIDLIVIILGSLLGIVPQLIAEAENIILSFTNLILFSTCEIILCVLAYLAFKKLKVNNAWPILISNAIMVTLLFPVSRFIRMRYEIEVLLDTEGNYVLIYLMSMALLPLVSALVLYYFYRKYN
jgi:hypothetical protein